MSNPPTVLEVLARRFLTTEQQQYLASHITRWLRVQAVWRTSPEMQAIADNFNALHEGSR